MLTDPGMSKLLSPKNILYACHSVTGAVPKGNATKENIQRMGFEEGQVSFIKRGLVFKGFQFSGDLQMPQVL